MNATVSVVIITKNEASNIRECLETVKWADEIIVVDDESADNTVDICREYTDKIFPRKMDGFGAQKQYAIERASCDWILSIDADERVSEELRDEIKGVLAGEPKHKAYKIWRKSFYCGIWIRHGGWYSPVLRLFKRGAGRFDMKYVHESIVASAVAGEIHSPILHYSYTTVDQHIRKIVLYTDYEARSLYEKGMRIGGFRAVWLCGVKPSAVFIRKYIFMRGFMDGIPGLIISVFTAFIVFLNYAKLWRFQER